MLAILTNKVLAGMASTTTRVLSDGGNIQNIILAMNMISLKGFKSYEDETLNNLHPRINIVLGRNGEGKSNFFKGTLPAMQPSILFSLTESPATAMSLTPTPTHIFAYPARTR